MAFPAPVLKPPIPPLKPPPAPPYRMPPILRDPPTETQPEVDIPNKPPTQTDLLGVVCIYSNRPIFTPKKICYKYPGQDWQEIAGDRFTLEQTSPQWNPLSIENYRIDFRGNDLFSNQVLNGFYTVTGGFILNPVSRISGVASRAGGIIWGDGYEVFDLNGTRFRSNLSNGPWTVTEWVDPNAPYFGGPNGFFNIRKGSFSIVRVVRASDNQEISPLQQCIFRVFNIDNNLIYSESSSVCPETQIIPAKCEYRQENEKLVKKWIVGFLQSLRVEYQNNCATVWLDAPPFFSTQVYRECSDPECPPPRIRFDKKCEEPCKKCPPGTVTRVLNGRTLLCVDGRGCLIKTIKFDSRCESYDCVC